VSKLPKHVQAALAEAEAIEKEMGVATLPDPDGEDKPEGDETGKAVETPGSTVTPEAGSKAEGEQHRSDPPKAESKDESVEVWKARYNSLRGLFEQQVPMLQQRVKELATELETVRKAPPVAPSKTPDPALSQPGTTRVTEKDVETFGGDLIDLVARKSQEVAESVAAQYQNRIDQLEQALAKATGTVQQVAQTQVQSAKERFFTTLDSQLPGWAELQATDACQAWLGEPIPGTDATWEDALKQAAAQANPTKALSVFRQFLKEHPQLDQSAAASTAQQTARDVQRQVAPPKSKGNAPAAPSQKRVWTSSEYEAETRKLINLQKRGLYEQAAQIENELNAAMAEGRIAP
jgi:hypothetical protein